MSEESQPISEFLPHLTILSILLVLEYWIFSSHATTLVGAGDFGPFVGIPIIVALVIIILIIIGFYSICGKTAMYKKIVSISLILFIVQMALIFLEYVVIATSVV